MSIGFAQTSTDTVGTAFEVASVKPQKPPSVDPFQLDTVIAAVPLMRGGPGTATPGRIRYSNVTLMAVIMKAYGIEADQVLGPGWLTKDRYAIDAIVPSGATREQFLKMLQNLVAERFKLAFQWEQRRFKVYRIVTAGGAPKLKPSALTDEGDQDDDPATALARARSAQLDSRGCPVIPPTRRQWIGGRNNCLAFVGYTMPDLARDLGGMVGHEIGIKTRAHVIDATGLNGRFDFNLEYDLTYHMMINNPIVGEHIKSSNPISIFKAIETQLGLKLEPTTSELKVMVIQQGGCPGSSGKLSGGSRPIRVGSG